MTKSFRRIVTGHDHDGAAIIVSDAPPGRVESIDKGETTVRTGDVVIQNGTNHAWANRSGRTCRIAFVLIDGAYMEALK